MAVKTIAIRRDRVAMGSGTIAPMTDDMLTPDCIHWLYTTFTRATEKLFLVNWPKTQIASE